MVINENIGQALAKIGEVQALALDNDLAYSGSTQVERVFRDEFLI